MKSFQILRRSLSYKLFACLIEKIIIINYYLGKIVDLKLSQMLYLNSAKEREHLFVVIQLYIQHKQSVIIIH